MNWKNKLTKFIRKYWIIFSLFVLLFINLIWAIFTYQSLKNRKFENTPQESQFKGSYAEENIFTYDSVSPDFTASTWNGEEEITLSNMLGNIIILRFSKFNLKDLPYLLYLEYLVERFKDNGVSLLFINTLGVYEAEAIERIVSLSTPIIEDNGTLSSLFNTSPNEVVIIGRDFRLKLKHNQLDNRTIYNQVIRFAFGDRKPPLSPTDDELSNLIKKVMYREITNNKLKNLGDMINRNGAIVCLFVSTCLDCSEQNRIHLMKEISEETPNLKKILLFGRGNSLDILKEFSRKATLNNYPISVGLIENLGYLTQEEYFKIFKYDVDPRLMIFNSQGRVIFLENIADERLMNTDYILNKIL